LSHFLKEGSEVDLQRERGSQLNFLILCCIRIMCGSSINSTLFAGAYNLEE